MEDLYDDLENYNEVDLVNELKTENAELKHKLGECLTSMDTLQKDFDKLSSEFRILETNYSSLLKIARAEVKRKTDMITNLNIEKDMLVLKQYNASGRKKQRKVNNLQNNKSGKNLNKVQDLKQSELNRKEFDRMPSEASSTATDISNRLTIVENVNKPNENHGEDVFPDHSGDYNERFLDKRVSMLTSHQFTKFSSDEEFEDMYSALEPKPSAKESTARQEPGRSRKRFRDDPQPDNAYYDTSVPYDKHLGYSESHRDHNGRNRNSRYYENDRGIHRDRDEHDSSRLYRNRYSPDRHRRGRRDQAEVRPVPPRDRQRRLDSPPRGRHHHRSLERRPYPDRERIDQKPEMTKNNHSDPHTIHNIHGESDEPFNKRQKIELPHPGQDRRKIDRQFLHDKQPDELRDRASCQSPDHLHNELVPSNEPIREIRSTPVTNLDDPRLSSGKYLKHAIGNKDVLCTVSSNEITMQPVNKSLWKLEKNKPKQLLPHPTYQISAELVNEIYMDIDNPEPNLALEPNYDDDLTDCQDVSSNKNETTNHDPADKNEKHESVSEPAKDVTKAEEKVLQPVKYKIPKIKKADKQDNIYEQPAKMSSKNDKADKVTHRSKHIEESQENHHSSKTPESIMVHDSSTSLEKNLDNMTLPELKTLKAITDVTIRREFEHKVYSIRHIVEGDLALSDETNDETQADVKVERVSQKKSRTRKKSHRDPSKEKKMDADTRKTRSKKEEVRCAKFSELFGDSSSLITPEELALATTQAHAELYAGVGDDAQHALPALAPPAHSDPDSKTTNTSTPTESREEKRKTKASKESKTRTHSKHKKIEHTRNESDKDRREDKIASTDAESKVDHVPGTLKMTIKTSSLREKLDKESNSANKLARKSEFVEETNELSLSNKKKSSIDETLLSTESTTERLTNEDVSRVDCQKSVSPSENKENASCDIPKENHNDMPQFFNDTLIPDENMSFSNSKENDNKKVKETISGARLADIPNLVPEKDEQGLVKTVVISTGVQPVNPTLSQLSTTEFTPLKALATSTPAKEMYTLNSPNEAGSKSILSGSNENVVSQAETGDLPDIRINHYRRRRKVLKKQNTG